jgi:TRAP-type mannitol/chloroaromatic compound transport system permease small subunit
MPNLTFVLPHWLYWSGLIVIPLVAMITVRRQKKSGVPTGGLSLSIAYMLWLTGGFVGLHRFYLRSALGIIYLPIFVAILYSNVQGTQARDAVSHASNELLIAEFDIERAQAGVADGTPGAAGKLADAEHRLAGAKKQMTGATAGFDFWQTFSSSLALVTAILLLIDAALLPRLKRRCAELEKEETSAAVVFPEASDRPAGTHEDPTLFVHTRFTDLIDELNSWVGEFVCYWSVIAVFAYYYEVLARYVFNSPTNWAHESMFLMFGMQYLISGGYTYRVDGHVRVDVLYLYLPMRARAVVDIFTSLFFFLFAGALLWTGWSFMTDSVNVWEVSFTEWAIQYWPVKSTMALGALLILLQGISKLVKDIRILTRKEAAWA